eukprot:Pgem_evm1s7958
MSSLTQQNIKANPKKDIETTFDIELQDFKDIDTDDNEIDNQLMPQGKWYHATGHICCAMIGTGVLGLSQAFSQLSWYIGPITLLIAFITAVYCSRLLSHIHLAHNGKRLNSYIQLGKYIVGPKHVKWVVLPWLYLGLIGVCIAYLITAGENIQSIVVQYSPDTNLRLLVYTTIVSVVQLVLALCPSLEKFEFISILGFAMSIVYTVIAIGLAIDLKAAGVLPVPNYSISDGKSTVDLVFDILVGLTTMAFAF